MAIPPLVEPGPDLPPERQERYARTAVLPGFGMLAQRRIRNARVLVVGAGGLGSAVLPALAAAGFGTIGIVDGDRVETSNLPRQSIHTPAEVGNAKVDSAARAVTALDAETVVRTFETMLTAGNALDILDGFDLVLDGSDNFETRYLVNDAAVLAGIPVVWGAVDQFGGQIGVSWAEHGPHYRDLFPLPPEPGSVLSCAEAGALPSVCAVVGGVLVSEAIKLVTGVGDPLLGRVLVHDALRAGFRELRYERDPEGVPVTALAVEPPATDSLATDSRAAITPAELQALLLADAPVTLIDVREPWEADVAEIPGTLLVPLGVVLRDPLGVAERLGDDPLVIVCHHGPRAELARERLASAGVSGRVLTGGIDAWARDIDHDLARY
ncbi:ThiF family adenylyltransferase [Leifsonia sp. NPDC058230]|uniref:ThiF family adenylyltransferase n=1 Tax=Leifsonia sp. NPDC058230 TaxID=3346391 RepID=UPI0036DDE9E2